MVSCFFHTLGSSLGLSTRTVTQKCQKKSSSEMCRIELCFRGHYVCMIFTLIYLNQVPHGGASWNFYLVIQRILCVVSAMMLLLSLNIFLKALHIHITLAPMPDCCCYSTRFSIFDSFELLQSCSWHEAPVLQNIFRLVYNHHKTTHVLCLIKM